MNLYRQAIILFGIVIPALIGLAVVGIGYQVKSKMVESYEGKLKSYKTHRQSQMAAQEIETKIIRQREHLNRWTELLSRETASSVSTNLKEITEKLPNKEIQQTAYEPTNGKGGFGRASAQESSQIRIAYRGTYRTLQRAFLELETRMPQLQLEELKMEPMSNSPSLINFQLTYTAWQN